MRKLRGGPPVQQGACSSPAHICRGRAQRLLADAVGPAAARTYLLRAQTPLGGDGLPTVGFIKHSRKLCYIKLGSGWIY
jgi:hypothetical protein